MSGLLLSGAYLMFSLFFFLGPVKLGSVLGGKSFKTTFSLWEQKERFIHEECKGDKSLHTLVKSILEEDKNFWILQDAVEMKTFKVEAVARVKARMLETALKGLNFYERRAFKQIVELRERANKKNSLYAYKALLIEARVIVRKKAVAESSF